MSIFKPLRFHHPHPVPHELPQFLPAEDLHVVVEAQDEAGDALQAADFRLQQVAAALLRLQAGLRQGVFLRPVFAVEAP